MLGDLPNQRFTVCFGHIVAGFYLLVGSDDPIEVAVVAISGLGVLRDRLAVRRAQRRFRLLDLVEQAGPHPHTGPAGVVTVHHNSVTEAAEMCNGFVTPSCPNISLLRGI